jgi:hypothetical protein
LAKAVAEPLIVLGRELESERTPPLFEDEVFPVETRCLLVLVAVATASM